MPSHPRQFASTEIFFGNEQASADSCLQNAAVNAALDAFADQWAAGARPTAENWLAEHPELVAEPELAVRLVYEELCLREDQGEAVSGAELYRRFPQWQAELAAVLAGHHFLGSSDGLPQFPEAGQALGDLQFIEELGRGASGRVMLASQRSLSDRPLVVKLTPRRGQEHLTLARLQHTNIVPLYLVQDFPESGLRAMCMPFLGGMTWQAMLGALSAQPAQRRSGATLAELLTEARRTEAAPAAASPALVFPARLNYPAAICWIGACLADGLHYAHQRGLVHLDVKPSNILLADDGQPMLLDFHLATELDRLSDPGFARLGGTEGYMSPEQIAAMEAIRRGVPVPRSLDGRSDIYSLGVVLYESLTGRSPPREARNSRAAFREACPGLSLAIEDIVHKCLAPKPQDRYQDVGQVAVDLRCELADLPLRTAPNRSRLELWRKWRRRRPQALLLWVGVAGALLLTSAAGTWLYRDRFRAAQSLLTQSQQELGRKEFALAVEHAKSGVNRLAWLPGADDLRERLAEQLGAARRAAAVDGLHNLVDKLKFLDDLPADSAETSSILAGCDRLWQQRTTFFDNAQDAESASTTETDQLRRDLIDLAVLTAHAEFQQARAERGTAAQDAARKRLDEARQLCGESAVLDASLRDFADGAPAGDFTLPDVDTAWEHCGLARWLMWHGQLPAVRRQLAAAIELEPQHFWAHFQLARCDFALKQLDRALHSADVCLALQPSQAECFFNRALCLEALGDRDSAQKDVQRALRLNPQLTAAAQLQHNLERSH